MKAITLYNGVRVLDAFSKHAENPRVLLTECFDSLCDLIDELAPGKVPADQMDMHDFVRAIGAACANAVPQIVALANIGDDIEAMNAAITRLQSSLAGADPEPKQRRAPRTRKR